MTPTEALTPALPQPEKALALSLAEAKTSRYLSLGVRQPMWTVV